MNRFEKAAEFGAMMGKVAAVPSPGESRLIGGAYGALLGGLGTAGYDWLRGTKKNRLRRALMGAGLGGVAGVGLGQVASFMNKEPEAPALNLPPEIVKELLVKNDLKEHPRMMHPLINLASGSEEGESDVSERGMKDWWYNHGSVSPGMMQIINDERKKRRLDAASSIGLGLANTALKGYLPSEAAIPNINSLNNDTYPSGAKVTFKYLR